MSWYCHMLIEYVTKCKLFSSAGDVSAFRQAHGAAHDRVARAVTNPANRGVTLAPGRRPFTPRQLSPEQEARNQAHLNSLGIFLSGGSQRNQPSSGSSATGHETESRTSYVSETLARLPFKPRILSPEQEAANRAQLEGLGRYLCRRTWQDEAGRWHHGPCQ